jgi:uncharacterized protein (TIGR02246 family)
MSHRPLYLVSLATIAFASPSMPRPVQDAVVREISRLEDAWAAAEVKRDGEAVGQLLGEDFLYTSPDGALHTKAQLIHHVSTSQTQRISAVGSDYRVKVYGNTAVIHGVVTMTVKTAAGTEQNRFRWTDTWVKQADGRWLCVAAQSSRMAQ